MDLYKAIFLAIGDCAVDVVHRHREGLHRNAALTCFFNIQADVGDFRVGVGAPRNRQCADPFATEEECVLHDDPGRRVGAIGEFVLQANVAGGVDARIRGAQKIVDLDTRLVIVDDACSL